MENTLKNIRNTTSNKVETINRRRWDKVLIPIKTTVAQVRAASASLMIAITILIAVLFLLSFEGSVFRNLTILVLITIGLFLIVSIIVAYLLQTSLSYIAESGKLVKFDDDILDTVQGRIVIKKGIFSKQVKYYGVEEFDRVSVYQSFLERLYNVGTLILEQIDTLENSTDVKLRYVQNPNQVARLVQSMIDIEKKTTQQIQQN